MAMSAAEHSDLYTGLTEVLGESRAEVLMRAIPLHDLDQVATKRDLEVMRLEMRTQIAEAVVKLQRTFSAWMIGMLVAVIAAMATMS